MPMVVIIGMAKYAISCASFPLYHKKQRNDLKIKKNKEIKGRTNITKEKKFTMKFYIDDERKTPVNEQRLTK